MFAAVIASIAVLLAQASPPPPLWLDRSTPANWNVTGATIPASTYGGAHGTKRDPELLPGGRCAAQIRSPKTAQERAVVRKGWLIFAPTLIASADAKALAARHWAIVLAMSDADGMCRPLAFQLFVFADGTYAGTLAPKPMDSRTDGTYTTLHFTGARTLTADFVRYSDADPLCCPHAITRVAYAVRTIGGRAVIAPTSAAAAKITA